MAPETSKELADGRVIESRGELRATEDPLELFENEWAGDRCDAVIDKGSDDQVRC